jgi:hypothetical protein
MHVFLSYSHKDQGIAKKISIQLSSLGIDAWTADDNILPGENWSLAVGKALQRSDAMVVLLSPDAVDSQSVRNDVSFALSSPKFEGRVVPVIVRPTKDIPWFLETLKPISVRGSHRDSIKRMTEEIVDSLTAAASCH